MIGINTNVLSMVAQKNLGESQNGLETAMERLSSGLRINSAKDDAAGQAIANRFSAQITGLAQAQRNSNDGISIAQTAEGGLDQMNDNLQRVRELTVQAANGTNSQSDLDSIQDEINQRLSEIDRVSSETDFNGTKVLAEGSGSLTIQVGANDGQTIEIGLRETNSSALGLNGFNVNGGGETQNETATVTNVEAAQAPGDAGATPTVGDYQVTTTHEGAEFDDLLSNMQDGNTVAVSGGSTYTFNAEDGNFTFTNNQAIANSGDGDTFANSEGLVPANGTKSGTYEIAGGDTASFEIDSTGAITLDGKEAYITTAGELTNNSGGGSEATIGRLLEASTAAGSTLQIGDTTFTGSGGASLNYQDVASSSDVETALNGVGDSTITLGDGFASAPVTYSGGAAESTDTFVDSDGELTDVEDFITEYNVNAETGEVTVAANVNGPSGTAVAGTKYEEEIGATVYVSGGALTTDETTAGDATENPLAALDAALAQVDGLRSDLGAVQNRFESAITNLNTNQINLSDARSRIEDADYAMEVADMTRGQILQQAGTSVLAQANQIPQNVLSLLG